MKFVGGLVICTALLGLVWALPMVTRVETDPELTAGFVEGDMVPDEKARNGLRNEIYKWPGNVVYYKFHTEFGMYCDDIVSNV